MTAALHIPRWSHEEIAAMPHDQVSCKLVEPKHVQYVWPAIAHLVDEVCSEWCSGRLTTQKLYNDLINGQSQLFVLMLEDPSDPVALGFAAGRVYEQGHRFYQVYAGNCERGLLDHYAAKLHVIEDFAQRVGCKGFEVHGRPAWGRVLGMTESYRVFGKELADGIA